MRIGQLFKSLESYQTIRVKQPGLVPMMPKDTVELGDLTDASNTCRHWNARECSAPLVASIATGDTMS